jgi:hypothetical protein
MTRNKKRGKLVTNQSEVKYIGSSYYLLGNDHYQFWLAVSLYFSIFYLARKENGNLWAFGFLNVITAIIQAIVLVVYRTFGQDWGVTQYSSLIYLALGLLLALTVIQAVLGREPKAKVA